MGTHIAFDRERLAAFCRRHHIRKLAFFGSVQRDDFRPDSDVDVLVSHCTRISGDQRSCNSTCRSSADDPGFRAKSCGRDRSCIRETVLEMGVRSSRNRTIFNGRKTGTRLAPVEPRKKTSQQVRTH